MEHWKHQFPMQLFKRKNTPLDTNIVFLHKFLIVFILILFAYTKYAQLERQSPSCSGSGTINVEHKRKLRLCITTAAYIEQNEQKRYPNGFGLYLPSTLFIIALMFLLPHKCQASYEEKDMIKLFEQAQSLPRSMAVRNIGVIIEYSYGVLSKRVRLSWECLEVDFCGLLLLDMVSYNLLSKITVGAITQGWDYVMDMWRITYPTTVKCEIGPQMVYAASNIRHYRCIVPHNEIYKSIWSAAAILLMTTILLSFLSLVYHTIQMLPFRRSKFFEGIVDIDDNTLDFLAKELPGKDDGLFVLKSYLLRLPCNQQRRDVIRELIMTIKQTSKGE